MVDPHPRTCFFWPDSLLEIPHAVPHLRSDQTVEETLTGW
jgi:hypothetical protein